MSDPLSPIPSPAPTVATPEKSRFSPSRLLRICLREFIAIALWSYFIIKLLVYDVDLYVVNHYFPDSRWVIEYKFFIFIGLFAIILLIGRRHGMGGLIFYYIFYPIMLILIILPYAIFRSGSWLLGFSFASTVFSFFRGFKYNFVVCSIYLISSAIIFSSDRPIYLWVTATVILSIVIATYCHRVILLIRPISLFDTYKRVLSGVRTRFLDTLRPSDEMRNLPVDAFNKQQLENYWSNISFHIAFNRGCLLLAKKLRDYQHSGIAAVASVFVILALFVMTTFSFSMINFAIYKIEPQSFEVSTAPTFFTFIYYTFNSEVFSSIKEVSPTMPLSQSVGMIDKFCSLFLIGIFVALVFSVGTQRYSHDLDNLILTFEDESRLAEKMLRDEFKIVSIDEAIAELQRLKSGLIQLILYLSRNIT